MNSIIVFTPSQYIDVKLGKLNIYVLDNHSFFLDCIHPKFTADCSRWAWAGTVDGKSKYAIRDRISRVSVHDKVSYFFAY